MRWMFAFWRQFAERTESSSSSTERNRFSFSGSSSFESVELASSSSSKLMKMESWSLRIFAAYATASYGFTEPFVQTSSVSLS